MRFLRLLATCFLAFLPAFAGAAVLSQRSPIAQGLWWDPARPGHGFEMFNVGDQLQVLWYTYDASNAPVWYTAQGSLAAGQPLPILKHRWANGRSAGYTSVGTLGVTIVNADQVRLAMTFESAGTATWTVQPFRLSGSTLEVDHSGDYYDPTNSGWGLTVLQQGDALGGTLFTYDTNGNPTWVAGFVRGMTAVEYFRFTGTCPTCAYVRGNGTSVGSLQLRFDSEREMRLVGTLALPMASGIDLASARLAQLGRPASTRPADRELARYDTPGALKAYLDAGMRNLAPQFSSGGDFSASPPSAPAVTFSTTNLQEAGVDEADLVKTDGRFVYTFEGAANGKWARRIRIAETAPDGSDAIARAAIPLSAGIAQVAAAGLYLANGKLASLTGTAVSSVSISPWVSGGSWANGVTEVELFDARSPGAPVSQWRASIDGHMVASRRIGDKIYVVSRFVPWIPGFAYGTTYPPSVAGNATLLANTPLDAMLPKVRVNGGDPRPLVALNDFYAPPPGSSPPKADILMVTAIDLANPGIVQSLGIVGSAETVYASPQNLWIATSRTDLRSPLGQLLPSQAGQYTDIHQVGLSASGIAIVASGTIEGFLGTNLDTTSWRLSEEGGFLRVVSSTTVDMGWGASDHRNRLTILKASAVAPGVLATVSVLPNAARPERIGAPAEQLHATRFIGNRLYAVTFPQLTLRVDPLFVIDVGNAADPRILGELIVPGFSDYLHPLPGGLLLGFGRDVNIDTGQEQGLLVSLFDVSDDGKPRVLQRLPLGARGSDSALLKSHHALSTVMSPAGELTFAFPARLNALVAGSFGTQPTWVESALIQYKLRGRELVEAARMSFPASSVASVLTDHAATTGRSILYSSGAALYVGNGSMWLRRPDGTMSQGF